MPKIPILTLVLAGLTIIILAASAPSSLRTAWTQGGFYLFSKAFVTDIPERLHGPGWFRFILQPVMAVVLGFRAGLSAQRRTQTSAATLPTTRAGFNYPLANLLLMGVLLDSSLQWALLGSSYPGAAIVVGPVLILVPHSVGRFAATQFARHHSKHVTKHTK